LEKKLPRPTGRCGSNDINNEYSGTVTVLPVTSASLEKVYPFEVFLPKGSGRLPKDSKAKADQIRTLDKTRLVKRIGKLENTLIEKMRQLSGFTWNWVDREREEAFWPFIPSLLGGPSL